MTAWQVIQGDALAVLRAMPESSVDCVVTSPPYWRMRDYGHPDQLGLEPTVEAFVEALADVFDEARRVLHPAGTCWVNLGDSYIRPQGGGVGTVNDMGRRVRGTPGRAASGDAKIGDLAGVPWAWAFEARRRGWYLRGEQIWAKSNPQPEGVQTRPERAHEHVFLLTKTLENTYNTDAVRTPLAPKTLTIKPGTRRTSAGTDASRNVKAAKYSAEHLPKVDEYGERVGASLRSVWSIASNPNRERIEHFAMMPRLLAEVCILAGSNPGAVVLDPFAGAGTVGLEALRLGRSFVGIELVPEFAELARRRLRADAPLLALSQEFAETPEPPRQRAEQLQLYPEENP